MAVWKNPVRAATTGAITLSNTQTVDGVALVADDRVLVKNQASAPTNGLYKVVSGGAWTRTTDADAAGEFSYQMVIPVTEGTVNGNTAWQLTTADPDPYIVGTTDMDFGAYTPALGKFFEFALVSRVISSNPAYLQSNGVAGNAAGMRMTRACRIVGASIQVNTADDTRAYKLSIQKNGTEVTSVPLAAEALGNHYGNLNISLAAGDVLRCAVLLVSGSGNSTFTRAQALVEIDSPLS